MLTLGSALVVGMFSEPLSVGSLYSLPYRKKEMESGDFVAASFVSVRYKYAIIAIVSILSVTVFALDY